MLILKYDLPVHGSSQSMRYVSPDGSDGLIRHSSNSSSGSLATSTVIEMEGISYFTQQQRTYDFQLTETTYWDALTIIDGRDKRITCETAQEILEEYQKKDDVFCISFLKSILLLTDEFKIDQGVLRLSGSWGCRAVFLLSSRNAIQVGPYFFCSRGVFQAWRLYADNQEAFVMSTIPAQNDPERYQTLNASAYGVATLCIAVPSRLYYKPTSKQPPAGMRVGIKDLFHLRGVATGCGNRAYRSLYPSFSYSSDAVQTLIEQGAIVVGKTKTAEFGGSQEVIGDWTDYSYSFNARADGYLVSTGSSTGSASGIAAYDWLDIGLGTDAGGSVRDSATAHGIYGLRPTHDGSAEGGAAIPCPIFQRSGFLSRSIEMMITFGKHWLKDEQLHVQKRLPNRVVFPLEYNSSCREVQNLVDDFIIAVCKQLDAELDRPALETLWKISKPADISSNFFDYFKKTFIDVLSNEYWVHAGIFRENYRSVNKSNPYVCPSTQWLWSRGSSITEKRKESALAEVNLHNSWFLENVLHADSTDENTIMIVPRYDNRYRDEYLPSPTERNFDGFDSNLHASLAGLPNIVVPIGQCSFVSSISGVEEFFPVSVSITGLKGTDMDLLKLADEILPRCGIATSVMSGKTAFPVED